MIRYPLASEGGPKLFDSAFDLRHVVAHWGSPADADYRRILVIFAEEAATLVAKAETALKSDQRRELVAAAHTLRGAAANMGAMRLAECAGQLEEAAPAAKVTEVQTVVAKLAGEWDVVAREIASGGPICDDG